MDRRQIKDVVEHFRPLGFFKGADAKTVDKLLETDDNWIGRLADFDIDPAVDPSCFRDLHVLAFDRDRVWRMESWEVLFAASSKRDGYAHCKDYSEVILQVARISAHAFRLAPAKAKKPGAVGAQFDKAVHELRFRKDGSSFAPEFLDALNQVIAKSGHEFVFVSNRHCTGFVLLLAKGERERLAKSRGWIYWPDTGPKFKASV